MAYWIIVVDDDTANLQMAGLILSRNDMRVTALRSGKALLDYVAAKGQPDLILLDINMPEMDGFEALRRLRDWEHQTGKDETPVIFLTADEEAQTERQGFEAGVSDYIRKPFRPDVLLGRINNILVRQETLRSLRSDAATDKLTGFLNKNAITEELRRVCGVQNGCLMMIDLDSFKLVNDIYGHDMGDRVLKGFSGIIESNVPEGSRCGRIGGDEFAVFLPDALSDEAAEASVRAFQEQLAFMLSMDDRMKHLRVNAGIVHAVPGMTPERVIRDGGRALDRAKEIGGGACCSSGESVMA